MAEADAEAIPASGQDTQMLLDQPQADFDIEPGEADIVIMAIPDIPPQQAPIIMLARATQPSSKKLYGTVGVCSVSPKAEQIDAEKDKEGYYSLSTRAFAANIFFNKAAWS